MTGFEFIAYLLRSELDLNLPLMFEGEIDMEPAARVYLSGDRLVITAVSQQELDEWEAKQTAYHATEQKLYSDLENRFHRTGDWS